VEKKRFLKPEKIGSDRSSKNLGKIGFDEIKNASRK
jgi:hypothetical protein